MRRNILGVIISFMVAAILSVTANPCISYASDEDFDYEEEKSDIEDAIAEREDNSEDTDELENEYNDVQDEQDNVNGR